ncbi:cytochrome-c peroxidase [Neoasaia chiangmaiensis]|uniref:Uncharacterized protein n=1 Tax=Neoasaia chiangmaiensis TaxID=320497 RepID=A0A1U9KQR7_9PROT|nr:cytochrome c peroxidase [Neoasaia chiangmaiensis]AQS88153.1 hypothetical protein A0U93_09615 [Neoasaia chiangmaiensis]GEN14828.1 cytochrome-c peroxidase [Neoasaia chiangmaiensis]
MRTLLVALLIVADMALAQAAPLSPAASLGRDLFTDPILSASGRQSCASCHDPANHYAPSNDLAVQPGGRHMERHGIRAVPSLTYLDEAPAFSTALGNPDGSESGPGGGFDWDGRFDSIGAQSLMPLTTAYEMANPDIMSILRRLADNTGYATRFRALFGKTVLMDEKQGAKALSRVFGAYQHEDSSFHPYTSKYDFYVRGLATLTPAEARGMILFNDAERANCAACHTAGVGPGRDGALSSGQFTDFFFRAVGAPHNPAIDKDLPEGNDLGLCGPLRRDLSPARDPANRRFCGQFMTPTLRNVATRHVFFHNGVFRSLRDVIDFYVTRDITPQRWYRKRIYDDLPIGAAALIDHDDMPFAAQHPGARPVLSQQEEDDIIAFMGTLTDGYTIPTGRKPH